MSDHRTITYPADAMQRVADQLCDLEPNLTQDDARDIAFDITIAVTEAVDKLRASEGLKPQRGDDVESWLKRVRDRHHPATTEWITIDEDLLNRYRECADYGLTLRSDDDGRGDA